MQGKSIGCSSFRRRRCVAPECGETLDWSIRGKISAQRLEIATGFNKIQWNEGMLKAPPVPPLALPKTRCYHAQLWPKHP